MVKNRWIHLFIAVPIFVFASSVGFGVVVDRIVAKVGPDVITLSEVEEITRQSDNELTSETISSTVNLLIDRILLVQEAKKEKINVPDGRVDYAVQNELNRIKQNFPTNEEFKQWLSHQQMTEPEVRLRLKEKVIQEILIGNLLRKRTPQVTDKQAEDFAKTNPAEAEKQERVNIRQILLSIPEEAASEDTARIREKAYQIYHELKSGGKFEDLVLAYSDDSGTRESGGELGYIARGESIPEIEKKAFSLNTNEISEPILTEKGYHIIQVVDKASTREYLYQKAVMQTQQQLVKELREKTPVTIKS